MPTMTITRTIAAPVNQVFDRLSAHADYKSFKGINRSELLIAGDRDKNGVGAVRKIVAGSIWFEELITAFERPADSNEYMGYFEYLIRKTSLPIKHLGGSVECKPATVGAAVGAVSQGSETNATEVVWRTTFDCTLPVIGGWLEKKFLIPKTKSSFGSILKQIDQELAA